MNRRELVTALGVAATSAATPLRRAMAQARDGSRRVGILMAAPEHDAERQRFVAVFREELARRGWAEGRNLRLDVRWAPFDLASIRSVAKELIDLEPHLILAHNSSLTIGLIEQTRTVPIVFANTSDPVGSGIVASFAQPGGNATGFTNIEPTMAAKWLELLRLIAPRTDEVAFLYNPATAPYAGYYVDPLQDAARAMGLTANISTVATASDIDLAIATQSRRPRSSFVVMTDSFLVSHRARIIALAAQHRLPAVYPFSFFVTEGGLLAYGNSIFDNFRRAAVYADRILTGTPPRELPVQTPVQFELAINVKTARALELEPPPSLLARADEVIE